MIGESPVLISKQGDGFSAVDAVCTHMHGYLPAGKVESGCIVCPVHHAQFNLKSGKMTKDVPGFMKMAMGRGATDLKSYELKVENGEIKVML